MHNQIQQYDMLDIFTMQKWIQCKLHYMTHEAPSMDEEYRIIFYNKKTKLNTNVLHQFPLICSTEQEEASNIFFEEAICVRSTLHHYIQNKNSSLKPLMRQNIRSTKILRHK